jgi:hypothetical protein
VSGEHADILEQHLNAAEVEPPVIHLIVAGMPRMLSDILREIASEAPGVRAVDQVESPADLVAAVNDAETSVVIAGSRAGRLPAACKALLERLRSVTVLTVTPEGRQGWVYRFPSGGYAVGELSPQVVRSVIRSSRPGVGRNYR